MTNGSDDYMTGYMYFMEGEGRPRYEVMEWCDGYNKASRDWGRAVNASEELAAASCPYKRVLAERERQDKLFPEWHVSIASDVLMEEVGEVSSAKQDLFHAVRLGVADGGVQLAALREELIQVAAVAIRWWEALSSSSLGSDGDEEDMSDE